MSLTWGLMVKITKRMKVSFSTEMVCTFEGVVDKRH